MPLRSSASPAGQWGRGPGPGARPPSPAEVVMLASGRADRAPRGADISCSVAPQHVSGLQMSFSDQARSAVTSSDEFCASAGATQGNAEEGVEDGLGQPPLLCARAGRVAGERTPASGAPLLGAWPGGTAQVPFPRATSSAPCPPPAGCCLSTSWALPVGLQVWAQFLRVGGSPWSATVPTPLVPSYPESVCKLRSLDVGLCPGRGSRQHPVPKGHAEPRGI